MTQTDDEHDGWDYNHDCREWGDVYGDGELYRLEPEDQNYPDVWMWTKKKKEV